MTALYARLRDQLSDALYAVELMRTSRPFRDSLVNDLREFGIDVPELDVPTARQQCGRILDAALARAGGLDVLGRRLTRNDNSSDASRRFWVLAVRLLPEPHLTLREKAATVEKLEASARRDRFGSYYQAVVGRAATQAFGTLWDLVIQAREDWSGPDELDPFLHVIALITRDTTDPDNAAQYRRRAEEFALHIDNSRTTDQGASQSDMLRGELSRPAARASRGPDDFAYIVLQLDPYSPRPDNLFLLSSWLFYGDELINRAAASDKALNVQALKREAIRLINDSIRLAKQHSSRRFEPIIEFILPRSQINLPVDKWSIRENVNVPLGTQHVVVVRDLDRQGVEVVHKVWQECWDRIGDGTLDADQVISLWILCTERRIPEGELYRQMLLAGTTGAGLTFPPESSVHDLEIWELLDAGLPIAVWPHRCNHQDARELSEDDLAAEHLRFQQQFRAATRGRHIRDLPGIVRRMRTEKDDFADEYSGMALLWDDPNRIVNPGDYWLTAPGDPQ